jgi:hypothetical protein
VRRLRAAVALRPLRGAVTVRRLRGAVALRPLRGAVAVALIFWAAPPSPARAVASEGYCPDGNGVTVVVDFNELGGGTLIRCAPGDQASGLTALQNAGVRVAGTNRWGLAFVCRIEGKPAAAQEPCIDTPPASAYWSYWHAANGGSWTYSQSGVTARKPPPGSFEGWSFAKDKTSSNVPAPGVAPRRPAAQPPPPPPPSPAKPDPVRTTAAPVQTTPEAPPSTAASPETVAASGAATTASTMDDAPVVAASRKAIPVPTVAGLALVLAVFGAAGFVMWRRRGRADE